MQQSVSCNGAQIPAVGFGTWELRGNVARSLVEAALDMGYRHIDTAQRYQNEAEVGSALRCSAIARPEIFLTTKVWPDRFRRDAFARAVEESVSALGTVPDLLLLHWPNPEVPLAETIEALNAAVEGGYARHIGVSNFTEALLTEAIRLSPRPLVTNQVEYHPFLSQDRMLAKCRAVGMALSAFCPLARGRVFGEETLRRIGARYEKSAGQVALRWLVQQDRVVALPRSSSPRHALSNLSVFDFSLTPEDMQDIAALRRPTGRVVDLTGISPEWDVA